MKRLLIISLLVISTAGSARASFIGIYSDATGASCMLAPGFNPNVTVISKVSFGTTGCRFSVNPGTGNTVLAFSSPWVSIGAITTDISLAYGACQVGSFVLGTIVMNLAGPGDVLHVVPAQGFPYIIETDCAFTELSAVGGNAFVGHSGDCGLIHDFPIAVEPSTWGKVKSLYR